MHRVLPFVQTVALSLITIACCTVQAASAQSKFDTMHIGAFDPDAWNGIVFDGTAYQERLTFAIRVGSKGREFLDGERIFTAVDAVGPHAPDGSYASISWRHAPQTAPITLEWARVDDNVVVGRRAHDLRQTCTGLNRLGDRIQRSEVGQLADQPQ